MTFLVKSATTGPSSPVTQPRTDAEILSNIQDIKIKRALIKNFGTEQGEGLFKVYKKEEPAPHLWKKERKIMRIPRSFINDKTTLINDTEPLHLPNGKKFYQFTYQFIENNQGEIEFWEKLEPLTREELFQQQWLQKHKQKWMKKDGDLMSQKFGLVLHRSEALKPEPISKTKNSSKKDKRSHWQHLINSIISIVKKILVFFQGYFKNSIEKATVSTSLQEVQHKKIIISTVPEQMDEDTHVIISSVSEKENEEEDYLHFFDT